MDMKRFCLSILGVFLSLGILVIVQHYTAMQLGYIKGLQLQPSDFITMAIITIIFCFLFAKLRSQSVGNGIVYGITFFLIMVIAEYSSSPTPYDLNSFSDNFWALGSLAQMIIMGIVASLIHRCKSCG